MFQGTASPGAGPGAGAGPPGPAARPQRDSGPVQDDDDAMSGSGKGLLGLWLYRQGGDDWALRDRPPGKVRKGIDAYAGTRARQRRGAAQC